MFTSASSNNKDGGEIVCILDALDECNREKPLTDALTNFYTGGRGHRESGLKFLVTSRPYFRIQKDFQILKDSQPTIHLSGESKTEAEEIAREIAIVIQQRIEELSKTHRLVKETRTLLYDELTNVDHRTYLWVYLVFANIEDESLFLGRHDLRVKIRKLPRTVEEAYDRILNKSQDPDKARRLLQAIIGAERPLQISEMAAILAFQTDKHASLASLERNLTSTSHLYTWIRGICGLFVVIKDSQVFLLHQTARTFLMRLPQENTRNPTHSSRWQHTFNLKESHGFLSNICIHYLHLDEFKSPADSSQLQGREDPSVLALLGYAANNWMEHYRQAHNTNDPELELLALQLCDRGSSACLNWLQAYERAIRGHEAAHKELSTSLIVASYFGLGNLVNPILRAERESLDATSNRWQRTALLWASEQGHDAVVRSLLHWVRKRDRFFRDRLPSPLSSTIVNMVDVSGSSPLSCAATNGHLTIVQHLLENGAKIRSNDCRIPFTRVVEHNDSRLMVILFRHGASPDERWYWRGEDYTMLTFASKFGRYAIVKMLLDHGAKVNRRSPWYQMTPLMHASEKGHVEIVKILLDHGAEVDHKSPRVVTTALMHASENGHIEIVKILLDHGADVNRTFRKVIMNPMTALMHASKNGHDLIVKMLLDHGAEVNRTSRQLIVGLGHAVGEGHHTIVKMLLDHGNHTSPQITTTALWHASENGYDAMAKLLLDHGA
ncbi:ankyrin repeat-containing domain protein [Xylariaceae sp. FL0255]|nr:ankyrin repeat-containing domain protein [Xylariaceae sp. FL0255]